MKVVVCDDEQLARDRLVRLLEKIEGCEVVAEAANGLEVLEKARSAEPDVVLLDIQMPGMDGLEAAEHITKLKHPPAVIFCTAYDEYAVRAFEVHAIGYLMKPVRLEDLEKAIAKAGRVNRVQLRALEDDMHQDDSANKARTHISAKTHRGIELIPIEDIRFFKADQKYVSVRYGDGEVLVDETLKEFENELGARFVRVHRNALVAVGYIEGLEMVSAGHHEIRLKGIDDRIQVSRRHLAGLRKLLQAL